MPTLRDRIEEFLYFEARLIDDHRYPEEFVAELRVVDVKKDSAACLVTQSIHEIETNDIAVARRGY